MFTCATPSCFSVGKSLGVTSKVSSFRGDVEAALDELAEEIEKHLDVSGLLELAREV